MMKILNYKMKEKINCKYNKTASFQALLKNYQIKEVKKKEI